MPRQASISDPSQQTCFGKHRNPCAPLFLPVITCGIYSLVWIYKLFDEARLYANKRNGAKITSGGAAVGFLFIPVFNMVWAIMLCFKLPGLVTRMRQADGLPADQRGSTGALGFLMVIPIIGGILWIVLTQNAINSFWKEVHRRPGFGSVIADSSRYAPSHSQLNEVYMSPKHMSSQSPHRQISFWNVLTKPRHVPLWLSVVFYWSLSLLWLGFGIWCLVMALLRGKLNFERGNLLMLLVVVFVFVLPGTIVSTAFLFGLVQRFRYRI